jgi:hypothetical protein
MPPSKTTGASDRAAVGSQVTVMSESQDIKNLMEKKKDGVVKECLERATDIVIRHHVFLSRRSNIEVEFTPYSSRPRYACRCSIAIYKQKSTLAISLYSSQDLVVALHHMFLSRESGIDLECSRLDPKGVLRGIPIL